MEQENADYVSDSEQSSVDANKGYINKKRKWKASRNPRTNYIVLNPLGIDGRVVPHDYTVIFLHGLGDTAKGYKKIFKENKWKLPRWSRIVLPTAKTKPVTVKNGE